MAQPPVYAPATAFAAFNPSAFPNHGTLTDAELATIATVFAAYHTNIALIQRDDGALKNGVVTQDSLADEIYAGINEPAVWVTATAYDQRDAVVYSGVFYKCIVAHTSGTFAADLISGYWEVLINFNSLVANLGLSDTTPVAVGNATAGVAGTASRADHVHANSALTLAANGKLTGTITSGTTAMTAGGYYRITAGTGTLPTFAADESLVVELDPAATVTATVGRNSQTIDGASTDDTYTGGGDGGVLLRYSYASAGAVRRRLIGRTPV